MEKKMNNKGFSLVELIVVIAIMAVLVGVLAPQFIKYVEKSRESTDIQNVDTIRSVVEAYYSDKEEKLPATVTIELSNSTVPKFSDSTNHPKCLSDAGVDQTKLKSSKWTSGIKMEYELATGKWEYTGTATYYTANKADKFTLE